jgi:hypothetical protein
MTVTVLLEREKETKNKVRFAEVGDRGLFGTLYVPKSTLTELGDPAQLEVSVQALAA